MSEQKNLSALLTGPTRRQVIAAVGAAFGGLTLRSGEAWAAAEEEISHTAEAIHQEPVFKASRKRLYEALTDAQQFNKVIQMSAAVKTGAVKAPNPPEISREPGGAFALFGGYIFGRQLELVQNERIVEAWRVGSWEPGIYSIAKFQLVEQGTGTKIVFDHTGFPKGKAEHLAEGWKINYWEPLEKFLA